MKARRTSVIKVVVYRILAARDAVLLAVAGEME